MYFQNPWNVTNSMGCKRVLNFQISGFHRTTGTPPPEDPVWGGIEMDFIPEIFVANLGSHARFKIDHIVPDPST